MFIAQTVPYLRQENSCTRADHWGASVASHELVLGFLRYSSAQGIHTFLRPERMTSDMEIARTGLQSRFPGREIAYLPQSVMPLEVKKRSYLFPVALETAPRLVLFRQLTGTLSFPVSAIVHTVPDHGQISLYFSLLLLCERCDFIVTTSQAGRQAVTTLFEGCRSFITARTGGANSLSPEMASIPLGVDVEEMSPGNREASRSLLGIDPSCTVILYLGRFSQYFKGDLEPLLIAFTRLVFRFPEKSLHLVLAGRASHDKYEQRLRSLAEGMGIGDNVTFIMDFPFSRKRELYRAADIFVSPVDHIQETFGLAVLDAMACGLPSVASEWSGYKDLIEEGKTGFLIHSSWSQATAASMSAMAAIQPDLAYETLASHTVIDVDHLEERLARLVSDPALAKEMGSLARQRACTFFSMRSVIQQYEDLWREQQRRLKEEDITPRLALDYNEIFQHFASDQSLDHDNRSLYKEDQYRSKKYLLAKQANSGEDEVRWPKFMANHGTLTASDMDLDAFLWSLKKGLLTKTR